MILAFYESRFSFLLLKQKKRSHAVFRSQIQTRKVFVSKTSKSCSLYQLTRRLGRVCGCSTHVSEFYFRRQKTLYTPKLAKSSASRFSPSFLFLFKGNLKTHAEAWAGERHKTLQEKSPAHRDREHSCIHRSFRSDKAMPSATQVECSFFQRLTPYYQYSVNFRRNPQNWSTFRTPSTCC